jgi:hypothetical protein
VWSDRCQVLGTVVMDLSELASFDGSSHQSLEVATNPLVWSDRCQVLGTVVMDLSELASFDGSSHQSLEVATNRAIAAAVGSPILTITVSCRWRGNTKGGKAYSEGGRSFDSSISTDTTTSTTQASHPRRSILVILWLAYLQLPYLNVPSFHVRA